MRVPVLITVALAWEEAAVSRGASLTTAGVRGVSRLSRARWGEFSLWLLRTGIGSQDTAEAIRWASEIVRPGVILSTGCAGALSAPVGTGDVVVPDEIVSPGGALRSTSVRWSERYRRATAAAGMAARRGRLFTSSKILLGPESKRSAAEETGAIAVDMEAFAVAEYGHEAGVEVAVARVVLDPLDVALPAELPAVTRADGRPSLSRLLAAVGRRPGLVADLIRLGRCVPRCRATLTAVHRELRRVLLEEEGEGEAVVKGAPVR